GRSLDHLPVQRDRRVTRGAGFPAERAQRVGRLRRVLEVLGGELVVRAHHIDQRAQCAAQSARERFLGVQDGPAGGGVLGGVGRVELLDQLFLGAEVVVGVAGGHAGLARDGPHRGRLVAGLAEQAQRRLDDRGPGLLGPWGQRSLCHAGQCRTSRLIGAARHAAGTTGPAAGTAGPAAGPARPAAGTAGPAAGTAGPAAGTAGPAAGTAGPAAGTAAPAAEPAAPAAEPAARAAGAAGRSATAPGRSATA